MSVVAAGIGAAGSIVGGLIGSSSAKRAARRAARERKKHLAIVNKLEKSRQEIINPYKNTKSLADMALDLSSKITNPFSNLGVATRAAEMQIQESDTALASSLDAMLASGAGAGGATALAQAALKSKQGVAASIESQEAANEKLRAQGEQAQNQARLAEQQRLQGIKISEGQRTQSADAAGKTFMFNAKEDRQNAKINRHAALAGAAAQAQASARRDQTAAVTGMIGSVTSIGMNAFAPS
jgi:hypothetical protein